MPIPKLSPEAWAAAVPPGMRALRRWVGHRDKVPLRFDGAGRAKVDDERTWGDFEAALSFYRETYDDPQAGVGFVFAEGDGLVFVDLDHVLAPDGGTTVDGAALLRALQLKGVSNAAYVEVSPSGTGLHVFGLGRVPPGTRHRADVGASHVELYDRLHYSTVTGAVKGAGKLGSVQGYLPGVLALLDSESRVVGEPEPPEPERAGEVGEALAFIDPDVDYESWLRVGMALKAGLGKVGLPLWVSWSAQGAKHVPGEPEAKWASFGRSGVGLGTLFRLAEEAGWEPEPAPQPAAADEFQVLEPDPGERELGDGFRVVAASEVAPEKVNWLWRGRLALGHLALLAGDGGQGKSIVSLDLAARLSRGARLPGEAVARPPGRVLLLNAEDGQADTLRPRLEAAGADLTRVVLLDLMHGGRPPQLPDDVERLERLLAQCGDVSLMVLDPLNTCLPLRLDSHKDQHVRQALMPLAALAQRHRVSVALVVHLNKANDMASTIYRVSGSIGIGAAARSVLFVGPDPDDDSRRVVAQAKPQLGPPPPSLAFDVVGWERDADVGVVRWLGESAVSAAGMTARVERSKDAGPWLAQRLAAGPVASAEVLADGKAAGYGRNAVYRAAQALGVSMTKAGPRGGWTWELPAPLVEVPEGSPPKVG